VLDALDPMSLLRQLAEAQRTTFIVKNLEHRYLFVNRRFADSIGLPAARIVGRNDLEIGIPAHLVLGDADAGHPGFWALDDAAIAAGTPSSRRERNVRYGPGPVHDADTVRTPLLDAEGKPVALLIQSRDVSDVVTLQRNLAGRDKTLAVREGQLSALADVMTMLTETLVVEHELTPLLERIAEAVVTHTGADEAWLWMCEPCGERLTVVAGVGADRQAALGRSRARGEGLVGRAWELKGTLYIADGAQHPATRPFCAPGTEVVSLPLKGEHAISGLLTVSAPPSTDGPRLQHELALLEKIAELASIAIANAQRVAAAKAELRRVRALTRLGRLLSTTDEPEEDLDAVCHALFEAIDITRAGVFLADGDGALQPHAAWTQGPAGLVRSEAPPIALMQESIVRWCCASGKPGQIGRHDEDPRESPRVHAMRKRMGVGSTRCVPIIREAGVIGALLISRRRAQPDFDDAEAELCDAVVDLLSVALERHALSAALAHQAYHDSLTGLPNRRRFEQALSDWLADTEQVGQTGAVMILDLDGFKAVNDSMGHAAGDTLLQQISARLSACLGPDDLLARMGGDEFAVLVPKRDSRQGTIAVANRLIEAFDPAFQIDGERLRIGTSVGIAHCPRHGRSADELLRYADAAMYRSKQAGRGRAA